MSHVPSVPSAPHPSPLRLIFVPRRIGRKLFYDLAREIHTMHCICVSAHSSRVRYSLSFFSCPARTYSGKAFPGGEESPYDLFPLFSPSWQGNGQSTTYSVAATVEEFLVFPIASGTRSSSLMGNSLTRPVSSSLSSWNLMPWGPISRWYWPKHDRCCPTPQTIVFSQPRLPPDWLVRPTCARRVFSYAYLLN